MAGNPAANQSWCAQHRPATHQKSRPICAIRGTTISRRSPSPQIISMAYASRAHANCRRSVKRNFVHVDDLVDAILAALDNPATKGRLYNVSMDEPVDYGAVAAYLEATRALGSINIPSAYHSNWLDNAKARFDLNWRPQYDLPRLIEAAWTYRRAPDDPRKVWYPG